MNLIKNIGSAKLNDLKCIMIISLISILLIAPGAYAVKMLSGEKVFVDSPTDDDVFATGGTVYINAPIDGAVIAGGNININAPVNGDVFVTGGQISINSDVKGKIVAAGGNIDLKGNARNVVAAGGNVNIHSTAVISKDAFISGGSVSNAGKINGNLTVRAEKFQNTGSAGSVDFEKSEGMQDFQRSMSILRILMTVGFLILGIVQLKLFPAQFFKVEEEVRKSTALKALVGFALIIVSIVLIALIAVTIIGLPVAAIMGMIFIISLMLSVSFVSFTTGKRILDLFKLKTNDTVIFIIGFIILSLLFRIPYIGWLIQLVAISLGFGAVYYALRNNWQTITAGAQRP